MHYIYPPPDQVLIYIEGLDEYVFPLVHNFIAGVSKKYPGYNTELASVEDIREFQTGWMLRLP